MVLYVYFKLCIIVKSLNAMIYHISKLRFLNAQCLLTSVPIYFNSSIHIYIITFYMTNEGSCYKIFLIST